MTENSTSAPTASAVRTWAKDNGHTVGDRGTIGSAAVAAYNGAHVEQYTPKVRTPRS